MKRILLAIAVLLISVGSASAVGWTGFVLRMATYTPDANVPSPTLPIGHCIHGASITLLDTAETFTGMLQTCNVSIGYGVASDPGACQNWHTTPMSSTGIHTETEVFAPFIRLDPITGFGTGVAVVTCKR